jgi:hypothetical protein
VGLFVLGVLVGPPDSNQSLSVLPELLRADLDRFRFSSGFNVAQPNGLGAKDQDGPSEKRFSRCHLAIVLALTFVRSAPNPRQMLF